MRHLTQAIMVSVLVSCALMLSPLLTLLDEIPLLDRVSIVFFGMGEAGLYILLGAMTLFVAAGVGVLIYFVEFRR